MINRRNIRIAASVITVIFLIGLVILWCLADELSYKVYRQKSYDNTVLYISDIREAVEKEKPLDVARIADGQNISLNWDDETESLRHAVYMSRNYSNLFSDIMRIAAGTSTSYSSYTPGNITSELQYVLKYADEGRERNPEFTHFYDAVERDTLYMLRTWLYITDDAATLKSYSDGQLRVLIEEAFNEVTGQ